MAIRSFGIDGSIMRWGRSTLLLLLGACTSADRFPDACTDDAVFAGTPPAAHDSATVTELWRVGGGSDAQLAMPLPLAISTTGRAAIADFMLGVVYVVEPDGTWRGHIARRGSGPGELSSPVAVVWDTAGSLYVYDLTRPAIIRFASDLSHVDERRVESMTAAAIYARGSLEWAGVQPSGATVFLPGPEPAEPGVAIEVALRVDPSGTRVDTLREGRLHVIEAGDRAGTELPGQSKLSAATGAGGVLGIIGGDAGWLVDIYDDGGSRSLRLCAAAPATPRRIVLGADGTIWVQREGRSPNPDMNRFYGEAGATWDVFSRDGAYERTIAMPAAARLQGALGDTVWAYEVSELDEVTLVAYRIDMR